MTKGALPTSRIGRSARLAGLAGRTVASRAHTRLRRHAGSEASQEAQRARQARLAQQYFEVMGGMKGAAMKAGQILSFIDADALHPAPDYDLLQSSLTRLQDDVPPLGLDEISDVIQSELGAPPDQLFAFFSPRPIAAASIGQVHQARLHNGTELAIKVQYPGVADAVRADLANTELFAAVLAKGLALLGPQAPRLDLKRVAEEVRDRVRDELDYRIEADNQQQFYRLYHGHPFIRIPAVHPEFSSGRVLASDYVHGRRWSDARTAGDQLRDRWGETIFRFVFTSLYHHGLFNADPHPGNYRFHEDGTVTFLDFGCVNTFTASRVSVMSALLDATLAGDGLRLRQAVTDLGLLEGDDAQQIHPDRLVEFYRELLRDRGDQQPFTYTPEWAKEVITRTYQLRGPSYDVTRHFRMPKDLLFLNRITIGATAVLGHLHATANWKAIDAEIRHNGPPATELGRQDSDWRAFHTAGPPAPRTWPPSSAA